MQYIEQLKGFIQYEIAIVMVLAVLSLVGKSCLKMFRVENEDNGIDDRLFLAPAIGAAVFSLPLVLLAHHGVAISSRIVWSVVVLLVLPLALGQIWNVKKSRPSSSLLIFQLRSWSVIPVAAAIGLLPYVQLMIKPEFPAGFGTSATWTNNDLGVYIQMATNVGSAGIRDAGLVTGWNAGLQASFDHPAAHSFFVAVARILDREPYQVGIVLIATIIAMILLGSVFVVRQLSQSKRYSLLLISSLVVINPPVVAAVSNFFYPQLFSLSIVIGYLGLAMSTSRNIETTWSPVLLGLISAAVFLISVEIAAMMIPLVSVFIFATGPRNQWRKLVVRVVGAHLFVFGIFFVVENDLFKSQLDVLTKLSGSGVAGWKSNFVSPSMIFGLVPNQYAGPYSSATRLFDVVILVALATICITKVVQLRRNAHIALALLTLIGLVTVAVRKWGVDGYQTWKLITSLTPLLMLLVLSLLLVTKNKERSTSAIVIAMFTVGATFSWTGSIWKESEVSSFINEDLAQIMNLEKTSTQTGLNVLLAPFFETMAASVISGAPTRLSSPTYFSKGDPILFRCTITTEEKLNLLPNHGPIEAQRGPYVLVGTPACD